MNRKAGMKQTQGESGDQAEKDRKIRDGKQVEKANRKHSTLSDIKTRQGETQTRVRNGQRAQEGVVVFCYTVGQ